MNDVYEGNTIFIPSMNAFFVKDRKHNFGTIIFLSDYSCSKVNNALWSDRGW